MEGISCSCHISLSSVSPSLSIYLLFLYLSSIYSSTYLLTSILYFFLTLLFFILIFLSFFPNFHEVTSFPLPSVPPTMMCVPSHRFYSNCACLPCTEHLKSWAKLIPFSWKLTSSLFCHSDRNLLMHLLLKIYFIIL